MIYQIIIFAIIGTVAGYLYRDVRDEIKKLHQKLDTKTEVGTTAGAYGKVNEFSSNQDGSVGLVEPKTPEQLDWEAAERLREAQLSVRVK